LLELPDFLFEGLMARWCHRYPLQGIITLFDGRYPIPESLFVIQHKPFGTC